MKLALIGATGNVGRKILEILNERGFNIKEITLFASPDSAGKTLSIGGFELKILSINECDFSGFDITVFSTDEEISAKYVPLALKAGGRVIDNSSFYRMETAVPLVVAPVNGHLVRADTKLISAPNCLASPLSIVLGNLQKIYKIEDVIVTTLQSVSGAGKNPMKELESHASSYLSERKILKSQYFKKQAAFNLVPQVGKMLQNGYCSEEVKIEQETCKIIGNEIPISTTTVRVPVFIGHSIVLSVNFSAEKDIEIDAIRDSLRLDPSIKFQDGEEYETPIECENKDEVFVARVRMDRTIKNRLSMWIVSDNLRRGAALDTVEILSLLLKFH